MYVAPAAHAAPRRAAPPPRAAFYDGVGTSPESLLLRIAGGQPGVPQPPLPPTFTTATPFLTIYFYSEPNS